MSDRTEAIVDAFNDCINRRDLEGLSRLMTDSHTFIDAASGTVAGKQACLEAWKGFFEAFPDYRNRFDRKISTPGQVVILGRSVCSDARLSGPAIWRAIIAEDGISGWHIFEDTPATRLTLGICD